MSSHLLPFPNLSMPTLPVHPSVPALKQLEQQAQYTSAGTSHAAAWQCAMTDFDD